MHSIGLALSIFSTTCLEGRACLAVKEREVGPDGKLQPEERQHRANHALRAHMLRIRKPGMAAGKTR